MIKSLMVVAVAFASFAFATTADAANCGTIRGRIDGVPASTRVTTAGASCTTARQVYSAATPRSNAFATRIRVGGRLWRAGEPLATSHTFRITYSRGVAAVLLDTTYH
jgi:hypothetical protein